MTQYSAEITWDTYPFALSGEGMYSLKEEALDDKLILPKRAGILFREHFREKARFIRQQPYLYGRKRPIIRAYRWLDNSGLCDQTWALPLYSRQRWHPEYPLTFTCSLYRPLDKIPLQQDVPGRWPLNTGHFRLAKRRLKTMLLPNGRTIASGLSVWLVEWHLDIGEPTGRTWTATASHSLMRFYPIW